MNRLQRVVGRWVRSWRVTPPRSIVAFVLAVLIVPDGRMRGRRYTFEAQPVWRLWFEAIASGQWSEYVATGPSQSGKTLACFIAPMLYHLTELIEPYVLGVPYEAMVANKWEADVVPVMRASPELRALLPRHGSGSGGGRVRDSVTLANGAICKFMSAGGQDAAKAGFTTRVFGITEAKGFSEIRGASDEADPRRQLQARQASYPRDQRVSYTEGTLGMSDQLPHTLAGLSTGSTAVSPCPHCKSWIVCEREHLAGWQEAKSQSEAAEKAHWVCPECGKKITDNQRRKSLSGCRLIHRGQTIDRRGRVRGPEPKTRRFYFRINAWHNCFTSAGDIAEMEWAAATLPEDTSERLSAERELCQFVWAVPWDPPKLDVDVVVDKKEIADRRMDLGRGRVPRDTVRLTCGTDIGIREGWYLQLATRADGSRHVADYGKFDIDSANQELAPAVIAALNDLREYLAAGLTKPDGEIVYPGECWWDASYQPDAVRRFVLKHSRGDVHATDLAAYGRGETAMNRSVYAPPKGGKGVRVRQIAEDAKWYVERVKGKRDLRLYWDTDATKYEILQMLTLPSEAAGSLTLHSGTAKEHERLARHLTAEPLVTIRDALGRSRTKFERKGPNHLLDCLAMAIRAEGRLAWRTASTPGRSKASAAGGRWYGGGGQPAAATAERDDVGGWYD